MRALMGLLKIVSPLLIIANRGAINPPASEEMLYEDLQDMEFEDGEIMEYE